MVTSLDISLREEVMTLRKKVVALETAESDNDRLRKELTKLKMTVQEEKSKFELDFMNQLSEIIRENALKIEEITAQLEESNERNRALSEQLKSRDPNHEMVQKGDLDQQNQHEYQNETSEMMNESNPVENESRDLNNSSRNESSTEQNREFGKTASTSGAEQQPQQGAYDVEENSCELNEDSNLLTKLEAELSSTKDLLAREKDISRMQEKDLNSKLEALQDTLINSERSRAALALEKERLIAKTSRIAEKKIQLEQKAKHQRQKLKELQKVVEENLNKVENSHKTSHKSDDVQIQCLRDQNDDLKRELLNSQDQVSQLNKTLEKEERESTVEGLAKENIKFLQEQMDKLQEEQTLRHMELSEVERRYKEEINALEAALESAHSVLNENVKARDEEVEKLKSLSEEKDNVTRRLEKEKEQIVLSMQDMMKNRRSEVDDLQHEIVEMNTQLANENREVLTLKSKLDQSNYQAKEMGRLRERVAALSRQLALLMKAEHAYRNSAPEIENVELRRKLEDALAKRLSAEEKLRKFVSVRGSGGSSKSVEVLQEENTALKYEVGKLTRKLEKMSGKLSKNPTVSKETRMPSKMVRQVW